MYCQSVGRTRYCSARNGGLFRGHWGHNILQVFGYSKNHKQHKQFLQLILLFTNPSCILPCVCLATYLLSAFLLSACIPVTQWGETRSFCSNWLTRQLKSSVAVIKWPLNSLSTTQYPVVTKRQLRRSQTDRSPPHTHSHTQIRQYCSILLTVGTCVSVWSWCLCV